MPLYDFKCPKCKHLFEKLVSLADFNNPVPCEKCNKAIAVRQMSTGIAGGGTGEPWEYEETHKANNGRGPNFVRDSAGNRHKFNPNIHRKGRKGKG
jgi:putative FmdB family regulatory protein